MVYLQNLSAKNPEHKLNDKDLNDGAKLKKTLQIAIQHYHPDKQDKEKHGRKWTVLCFART